jgi:general secretion pathway protein B
MSFILDALRKSEQERQRGTAPALQLVPPPAPASRRPGLLMSCALGAILVGAGIAIGWLRPWQPPPPVPLAAMSNANPVEPPLQPAPAPLPASSVLVQEAPAPANAQPLDVTRGATLGAAPAPVVPAASAAVPDQKVFTLAELPLAIQQEIPAMSISVHAYSARPQDRMVGINDKFLREGASLQPGLTLEEITPEGMVFSYKGHRFSRGVRTAAESR